MRKKLYKSQTDRKICGVCGGIAEYFNIDSTIVRLIWAIFIFCLGTGFLAYILAALVLPNQENY
ncbi:MAG: PspC domain-containing protein [Clostridia bacterium]|nr:PspC domain-containing protein [Clostridia bacterium]